MDRRKDQTTSDWGLIVDHMHESIITTDAEGLITNWNKGAERLFGYSATEAIGLHADICHARSPDAMQREIVEPLQRDGRLDIYGKMVRKSGETFDGHMLASLIKAPDGEIVGMVGYTLHVTEQKQAEDALRQYEKMVSASPDLMSFVGPDYRYLAVNDAYEKAYGRPKAEIVGHEISEFMGSEPFEQIIKPNIDASLAGESNRLNHWFDYPGIGSRCMDLVYEPVRDEDGGVSGVAISVRDVTERTLAEQGLQQSESNLAAAQRLARLGNWEYEPKIDKLTLSDETFRLLGVEPQSFEPTVGDIIKAAHPDDRIAVEKSITESIQQGIPFSIDHRIIRPDGEVRYVHVQAETVVKDQDGATSMVGFTLDITERKLAEEELRKSEANLAEVLRIAELGHWEYDVVRNTTWWSEASIRIFGLPPGSSAPEYETFLNLFPANDHEAMRKAVGQCATQGIPFSLELEFTHADGSQRFLHSQGEAIRDKAGKIMRLAGTNRDITKRKRAEVALQKAYDDLERRVEQRTLELRTTLETLVEGVITIDDRGVIESFNASAEIIFGYSANEVVGQNVAILMPDEDKNQHNHYIRHYLDTGEATVVGIGREVMGRRKDGSNFNMRLSIGEMQIGKSRKFVGTVEDITEHKAAQSALEESELNLRNLTDLSPVGIYRADLEGRITYANDRTLEIGGIPDRSSPHLGHDWQNYIYPDDREPFANAFIEAVKASQPFAGEYRFGTPGGRVVWALSQALPERDESGAVTGYMGTLTDISERVFAEAELRSSEQQLDTITNLAPVALVQTDRDGMVTFANDTFLEIVGCNRDDVLDGSWTKAVHPDDVKWTEDEWHRSARAGDAYDCEYRVIRPDGKVIWVWGQTVPVRDEYGNVARHIGTVTDVTDRKVAEGEAVIAMTNAETANRAKSDFLSSMSPGCVKTIGALSVLGGSGFEVRAETGFPLLGV